MPQPIKTCDDFQAALQRIPFAKNRIAQLDSHIDPKELPLLPYGLWHFLLDLVHQAISQQDWPATRALLNLYDQVQKAGKKSQMFEASYVAFLEDVRPPADPAHLRYFWQACPPTFLNDLQRDRGIR